MFLLFAAVGLKNGDLAFLSKEVYSAAVTAVTNLQKKKKAAAGKDGVVDGVTQLESLEACRSSFVKVEDPTVFNKNPVSVLKVLKPSGTEANKQDHFDWRYSVQFTIESDVAVTGVPNFDVTVEVADEHLAACIALLPRDKVDGGPLSPEHLTRPVTKLMGVINWQWTKVQPDIRPDGTLWVTQMHSAVRVVHNGAYLSVPLVDFKKGSVVIETVYTNKYDLSLKVSPTNALICHPFSRIFSCSCFFPCADMKQAPSFSCTRRPSRRR